MIARLAVFGALFALAPFLVGWNLAARIMPESVALVPSRVLSPYEAWAFGWNLDQPEGYERKDPANIPRERAFWKEHLDPAYEDAYQKHCAEYDCLPRHPRRQNN